MEGDKPKQIPVVFYRTSSGTEVVRDWLQDLEAEDRHAIGLEFDARTVPLAGGNAAVPVSEGWPVRSKDGRCRASGLPELCSAFTTKQ